MKRKIEINLLIFAVILFFQRMAFPYTNYLFIPYCILLLTYFLLKFISLKEKFILLVKFLKVFYPLILVSVIFIIAFIFSTTHYIILLKEVFQIAIIFLLLIIVFFELKDLDDYNLFTHYFILQVFISSSIIGLLGLMKFIFVLSGAELSLNSIPLFNSSLSNDYNFYSLSIILGIISILFVNYKNQQNRVVNITLQIILFMMSLNIIFSGSRRGFIFYLIFFLLIVSLNFWHSAKPRVSNLNTRIYLLLKLGFMLILMFYISTYNSALGFNFKRSSFNINFITNSFFNLSYRYASIFNVKRSSVDKLMSIEADPRYPYTRWGTRIHKEVFPLEGKNVEIVPPGTVGYRMDSTCNTDTWNGNAYSYTPINALFSGDTSNDPNTSFQASAYCYVSPDFNGSWVRIAAEGNATGKIIGTYDLERKGTWQKLEIDFQFENGLAPVHLYISKSGETDFSNLKGHVIYAFPEYFKSQRSQADTTISFSSLDSKGLFIATMLNSDLLGRIALKAQSFFKERLFLTDTVTSDPFEVEIGSELSTARKERWRYSYYIFMKEYSITQKVFGGGFKYMEKFGVKFREVKLDYPHNPFIDSFLYSGLAGGLGYIYFMFFVFWNYVKYFKYHRYFFACFLVVFFFCFVSVNTHFSIPVFTFLSAIPFFTRYLVEERKLSQPQAE